MKLGKGSLDKLSTVDERLQRLVHFMVGMINDSEKDRDSLDFTITCGHRSKDEQDKISSGNTLVKWPNSKHNKSPSLAVDWAVWDPNKGEKGGIDYDDRYSYMLLGFYFENAARLLDIPARWGGKFRRPDSSTSFRKQYGRAFEDLCHGELIV